MDALLDKHFQRVETALNTLIDSIASYNPSQQAVVDLVAADDELSRGLEQRAPASELHLPSLLTSFAQSPRTRPTTSAFWPCARPLTPWTPRSSPP